MMPRKLSHRTSRSSFTFPMKVPQRVAAGAAVVVAALIISSVVNRFIAKRAQDDVVVGRLRFCESHFRGGADRRHHEPHHLAHFRENNEAPFHAEDV